MKKSILIGGIIFYFLPLIAQEVPLIEKPKAITKTSTIALKPSKIYVPIEMNQSLLKKLIANATPEFQTLANDSETEIYHFNFKLTDGSTSMNDNQISHNIRFTNGEGTYKRRTSTNKPWPYNGILYSPWATFSCKDIRGNANLKVNISLQSNYQLKAKGEINALIDNIACANMNITGLTKTFGWNSIKENITQNLEHELRKVELKKSVQVLWNQLQSPYKINNDFYIIAQPFEVSYTDLTFKDGKAKIGLGLSFYASTCTPIEAEYHKTKTPLPDLKKISTTPSNLFDINLPIHLPYSYLDRMAKELATGYEITTKNKKGKEQKYGKIEEIEVFGSSEPDYDVVIALQTSIYKTIYKKNFVPIYLHAKLGYDSIQKKIVVKDYKMDPKTENGLYNLSLKTLANKIAYSKVLTTLKFSIEKELAEQKLAINNYLQQQIELTKGVQLSGLVNSLELEDIVAQPDKLTCLFTLKGQVKIEVLDIKF